MWVAEKLDWKGLRAHVKIFLDRFCYFSYHVMKSEKSERLEFLAIQEYLYCLDFYSRNRLVYLVQQLKAECWMA
jgi:hypothetical protein